MNPTIRQFEVLSHPIAAILTESLDQIRCHQHENCKHVRGASTQTNTGDLDKDLEHSSDITWELDGTSAYGDRLYAIPKFARNQHPLRVEICIVGLELRCIGLSGAVSDTNHHASFSTRNLLQALSRWSAEQENFETIYMSLPYGSRIIIDSLNVDVDKIKIEIHSRYDVESQWMTVKQLQALWQLPLDNWPPTLDLSSVKLQKCLNETISLVKLDTSPTLYVYKSLLHDLPFMYHELRILLTMKSHPDIVSRPLYVVTKQCRFGHKVGVCGFILEYYGGGTLEKVIYDQSQHGDSDWRTKIRWALEITDALQHIQNDDNIQFHSDLKLNNIMLHDDEESTHIKIIDLEQRNNWYSWSAPEVRYLDYYEYLAFSKDIDAASQKAYRDRLRQLSMLPNPNSIGNYKNPKSGYNIAWNILSKSEQEFAMVFSLGKILWCIFEECWTIGSCPNRNTVTFQTSSCYQTFPDFKYSPEALRNLIKKCTLGAWEWQEQCQGIVECNGRLYPHKNRGILDELEGTAEETERCAIEWWKEELQKATDYFESRIAYLTVPTQPHKIQLEAKLRPSLVEIHETLQDILQRLMR